MKKSALIAFLAIVAVPLIALAAPQDTLRKAIVHIATMQDENGAWSRLKNEFPSEAEPTSWAVKVLAMNGMAPEKVDRGVAFLLKDQRPDGSWSNNTAATAFTIMVLKQTNKDDEAVKKAIQYLRDIQDNVGGFKRLGKEGAPLTIYTAVVLVALHEAGVPRNDPMVRMAIDWLMGCQNADGGYPMPKGTPSLSFSTGWTVRALLAYGVAPTTPFIKDAVEYLLTTQKPSGGFAPTPAAPEDPEVTSNVIVGLSKFEDKKPAVVRAVDYLGKAQQPDGAFISSFPIQFNKVARKNTQTTCWVAWAISEAMGKDAGGSPATPSNLKIK
ncbi:MAG: prenyltransferase/squalene oxidase repeat-containing protein [Syntrophorhabdus sp.]|jgi:prenyltransferase beta subunit